MKLPVVSSEKVVKALGKIGFEPDHQKGSHLVLRKTVYPLLQELLSLKGIPCQKALCAQ